MVNKRKIKWNKAVQQIVIILLKRKSKPFFILFKIILLFDCFYDYKDGGMEGMPEKTTEELKPLQSKIK